MNKTFRLFVSSTFQDFQEEREMLNDIVAPELNQLCSQKGYSFQLVDLRWGVETEAAINHDTIGICLSEVHRCAALSPRPNFLLMLGERYGWIPAPVDIPADDFTHIFSVADATEKKLLRKWYMQDRNSLQKEYHLLPRAGDYLNDSVWADEERAILRLLRKHCSNCSVSERFSSELTTSATAREIQDGFLKRANEDNAIAVFRSDYSRNSDDTGAVSALKARITEKLSKSRHLNRLIKLSYSTPDYRNQFVSFLTTTLTDMIGKEIQRLESAEQAARAEPVLFPERTSNVYFPRKDLSSAIHCYLSGASTKPLLLYGESGSGKTTLLSECLKNNQDYLVVGSFWGTNANSYSLLSMIAHVREYLIRELKIPGIPEVTRYNLSEAFLSIVNHIPSDTPVAIILDGIDSCYDFDSIHEQFVPSHIPSHVKLIISGANDEPLKKLMPADALLLQANRLSAEAGLELFSSFLAHQGRTIANSEQKTSVTHAMQSGVTPLQALMLSDICANWRSYDPCEQLPSDSVEIALKRITDMFQKRGHNESLVIYALALIATSPYGITERELQELLLRVPEINEHFAKEDRYHYTGSVLPFSLWSRLFYDLGNCLTITNSGTGIVVKFSHLIYQQAFFSSYHDAFSAAEKLLAAYYLNQENNISGTITPNLRKVSVLPEILIRSQNWASLRLLFMERSFVDMSVRAGLVDESIRLLSSLLQHLLITNTEDPLYQLFRHLNKYRAMLYCYRNSYAVSLNAEAQSSKAPNHSDVFPFSNESSVFWAPGGERMAVSMRSLVFICDTLSGQELSRIFLCDGSNALLSKEILWMSDDRIAITTSDGFLGIYDLKDPIPQLLNKSPCRDDTPLSHSKQYGFLLFLDQAGIVALDLRTFQQRYAIILDGEFCAFCMDESADRLLIRAKHRTIVSYRLSDGEKIETLRIREPLLTGSLSQFMCMQSPNEVRIDYDGYSAIYELNLKTAVFLYPPMLYWGAQRLSSKKTIIIQTKTGLLWVDTDSPYCMRFYSSKVMGCVFWVVPDQVLGVTSDGTLRRIHRDAFTSLSADSAYCFHLSRPLARTLSWYYSALRQLLRSVPILTNDKFSYASIFDESNTGADYEVSYLEKQASLVIASESYISIAFESANAVAIYDRSGKLLIQMDQLALSLSNNILRMQFTENERHFLLWTNNSITVIDLRRRKKIWNLNLCKRCAYDVRFCNSDTLQILLSDNRQYKIDLHEKKPFFPDTAVPFADDRVFGPISCYDNGKEPHVLQLIDGASFEWGKAPAKWCNVQRAFTCPNVSLFFDGGSFFLNGDPDAAMSHPDLSFRDALQIENSRQESLLDDYFRQKNDLLMEVYTVDRHLLLLCSILMNSVILFDPDNRQVLGAYKHPVRFIGAYFRNGLLELFEPSGNVKKFCVRDLFELSDI